MGYDLLRLTPSARKICSRIGACRPTIYIVVFKQLNKTGGIGEMLGFTDTAAGPASGFGPRAPVDDSLRLVRARSCTNSLCRYIGIRIKLSPAAEHVSQLAKLLTPQLSLGYQNL